VEGHHAYDRRLSAQQWIEFGAAMKKFHTTEFPEQITRGVRRETFSSCWRETVKTFVSRIEEETFDDPVAAQLAGFLKSKRIETLELIHRSERLGLLLQEQPLEFILCHADIHGWNLLIRDTGELYIVDWDTLILAPKERDLMFIGGAIGKSGYSPQEEENLFYQGYGRTDIDQTAMAHFRYERIVEDIAVECEQILAANDGGEDRRQALEYLASNFLPDGTINRAFRLDRSNP
jgi:spectinomycin phosphotransferase